MTEQKMPLFYSDTVSVTALQSRLRSMEIESQQQIIGFQFSGGENTALYVNNPEVKNLPLIEVVRIPLDTDENFFLSEHQLTHTEIACSYAAIDDEDVRILISRPSLVSNSTAVEPIRQLKPNEIAQLFGPLSKPGIDYKDKTNGEIEILNKEVRSKIKPFKIEQLIGYKHVPSNGEIECNERIAPFLQAAFAEIEQQGLLSCILTFDGLWVPRHINWNPANGISPHSWGTAFDINANWNGRGNPPAKLGEQGCVRELVPIFEKHGFYWGGNFSGKSVDGMHFQWGRTDCDVPTWRDGGDKVVTNSQSPFVQGESFEQKAPKVMRLLMADFSLTDIQAAGILGNIGHECAGFKDMHQKGMPEGQGGYGWCQWDDRREAFFKWCKDHQFTGKDDWKKDDANYGYLKYELKETSEKKAIPALQKTTGLEEAVKVFEEKFERAKVKNYPSRNGYAEKALKAFKNSKV